MTDLRRSSSMIECNGDDVALLPALPAAMLSRDRCRITRREYDSVESSAFRFDLRHADLSRVVPPAAASAMASMVPTTSAISSVVDGFQSGYTRRYDDDDDGG